MEQCAAIRHIAGLKAHQMITHNDALFKRWVGAGLVVSLLGLMNQIR
jgi:hypothetical protein